MLLPAATAYIDPATLDVESAYGTYHALWPRQTLDTWSSRAILRISRPEQVRDDESERWLDEGPPNGESSRIACDDESERWPDARPPNEEPPCIVRDNESERWPDEWPPSEETPRIARYDDPPPPYTELPPTRPADSQQGRKKPVQPQSQTAGRSARKRCLGRLKTEMAALRHQAKTRWVPEFIVLLGYLAGYDRDGKSSTTLGLGLQGKGTAPKSSC